MSFLLRLLRFVFWVMIVSWAIKWIGRLWNSGQAAGSAQPGAVGSADVSPSSKRLVRDPVCGMHVAQELALPFTANGETQFFCSAECREKYESSILRRAANG